MVEKRLLCPNRRRRTPAQFSWLDHRLMRERRLESCPLEAWALYLFLVTPDPEHCVPRDRPARVCKDELPHFDRCLL